MGSLVVRTRLPVVLVVLPVPPGFSVFPISVFPIDNLRRNKGLAKRITRRIQFEAVYKESVMIGLTVDGESQLKVARPMDLQLNRPASPPIHQNRAAGTFDVDDLVLSDLRGDILNGVGNVNIRIANLRRDKECVGGRSSQEAGSNRERFQQHNVGRQSMRFKVLSIAKWVSRCCLGTGKRKGRRRWFDQRQ
jgi:hypothetical protein